MAKKEFSFDGGTNFDWEGYLKYRPDYTLSNFYDIIWNYHSKHGNGKKDLAYDVGCGPGQVAKAVIEKGGFARVKASDPNVDNIAAGKYYTRALAGKIDFQICKAEEVGQEDLGKVDLITGGMCLHLTHHEKAIENFAKLLAPGGTLAVWIYGGAVFTDENTAEITKVHRSLVSTIFDEYRPFKGTFWESSMNMLFSWMDNVGFAPENWRDVQRIKWNKDKSLLSFLDEDDVDYKIEYQNKVSKDEVVDHRSDSTFWAADRGFEGVEGEFRSGLPSKHKGMRDEVKKLYGELEQLMGGKTWNITRPVVLLLATKK